MRELIRAVDVYGCHLLICETVRDFKGNRHIAAEVADTLAAGAYRYGIACRLVTEQLLFCRAERFLCDGDRQLAAACLCEDLA